MSLHERLGAIVRDNPITDGRLLSECLYGGRWGAHLWEHMHRVAGIKQPSLSLMIIDCPWLLSIRQTEYLERLEL